MNLLLLASHGVAEYDDVRMFSDMGVDVFAPGGYSEPSKPGETLRPALPNAPDHPDLRTLCDRQREKHAREGAGWAIDWAKADLHPDLVGWADVIVVHHFPDRWIAGQWGNISRKRVVWRTCGQSDPALERLMSSYRGLGLQIVRYSPAEERAFRKTHYAGHDAVIRFGKYPDDYGPWIGDDPVVGNVTQHMLERGDACGYGFWKAATRGLPVKPAGPGSEKLPGGVGTLAYDAMRDYLRHIRAYLYTGTQPASYTLGLIEAMLSGVPVVSIGPRAWGTYADPDLFEGHEIANVAGWAPDVGAARGYLGALLYDGNDNLARSVGASGRQRAIDLFGIDAISAQWREFLR